MAKKRYLESDFFEGYSLIGIVCGLPDFRISYFINRHLHLHLRKYAPFSLTPDKQPLFSWYHYEQETMRRNFFLMQNKNGADFLLHALRKFDYLLLLYGNIPAGYPQKILADLRTTPYITAAYEQNLAQLKNTDLLIAQNEHHATKQLAR